MAAERQPLVPEGYPTAPPHADLPTYRQQPAVRAPPSYDTLPPQASSYSPGPPRTVTVVHSQPLPQTVPVYQLKPPNYIGFSIIILLFFCPVCAILALMFALQVDQTWASGDRDGAKRKSIAARNWNIVGLLFGIFLYVSAVIVVIAVCVNVTDFK